MCCKKYRYITWHRNWPCPGSSVSHMVLSWLSRSTASSRSTCSGCCLVGVTFIITGGGSLVESTLMGRSGAEPGVVGLAGLLFALSLLP